MRNFIYFLGGFTSIILIVIFSSVPANAASGGGGSGGSWGNPTYSFNGSQYSTINLACTAVGSWAVNSELSRNPPRRATSSSYTVTGNGDTSVYCNTTVYYSDRPNFTFSTQIYVTYDDPVCDANQTLVDGVCVDDDPVCDANQTLVDGVCVDDDDPPPPPPTDDCNMCARLYDIQLKLIALKSQDITIINNIVNDMQQTINNIDNSINDLSINQELTNNYLTVIDNSIGDLVTNIENNNITNNEILNSVNNINNYMNDYSLKLGDIDVALGDISVDLDNTNRLVLDLGVDLDFIKNKIATDDSKDYTPYLQEIINLLAPCVPTADKSCKNDVYDDDELIALLTNLNNFIQSDFVPDDSDTKVDVDDMTNIDLDRNLIQFGVAQCPPDENINTMVNGFAFTSAFKHEPLCRFFTMLAPFIKSFGGFSAALILGGGLRRG